MQRRTNLIPLVLTVVIVLGLTPLMVCIDAQARIAFVSERDGNFEIYVIDANGGNQRNLTKHGGHDRTPAWYTLTLAVAPAGKALTMWGWLKRVDQ